MRERADPDVRLARPVEAQDLRDRVRDPGGLAQPARGQHRPVQLELEVGHDRDQVGVAGALAVAVERALDVAPASTAARVFATAQPVSLWQWMPTRTPVLSRTSCTTSATQGGSMPPLVSHSAITSAPAPYAVRSTSSA